VLITQVAFGDHWNAYNTSVLSSIEKFIMLGTEMWGKESKS